MPTADEQDAVDGLATGALFSPCRRWRYMLWRRWNEAAPSCMFVGLNPSTADETKNDPTVTRCINYAKAWGYGSLWMLNIFAFRATDPMVMKSMQGAAVGPRNDEFLVAAGRGAGVVVAAWGTHGTFRGREPEVRRLFAGAGVKLSYLRLTQGGHPSHPLYLPRSLEPVEWPHLAAVAA